MRMAMASSAGHDSPPRVDAVVVVRHTAQPDLVWRDERDHWSHDLTDAALAHLLAGARRRVRLCRRGRAAGAARCRFRPRDLGARHSRCRSMPNIPMFFIYTSGSTGKPKGVVHVHGGYAAGVAETMPVAFDARAGRRHVRRRRSGLDHRAKLSDLRRRC